MGNENIDAQDEGEGREEKGEVYEGERQEEDDK